MFKTNSEVIKIEAKKIKPINTGVVFWSHDRGTAKLKFKLMKDNLPQPIPDGTTVPIRLTFSSPTAEGGIGKHDYLATIEDKIGGIVSITLQDNILGYQGIVHGSIYMDFPGNTSLDTAGRFSFEIQRSPIDETTPELEDYYFNGFSKVIDQIEQLINDTNKRIDGLNTEIDKANGALDRIEDEIKESAGMTEKFINSIDFGDYDYSGNPNLMANINADSFSQGTGALSVVDDGDEIVFTLDPNNKLNSFKRKSQPALLVGKTYTLSAEIMLEDDFTGDPSKLSLRYIKMPDWLSALTTSFTLTNDKGVWQKVTTTGTMTTAINDAEDWFIMLHNRDVNNKLSGKVRLRNIKIEEGSTATPYQPNLLDAPYYLSKAALGENIITSKSYDNSNYFIGSFDINKTINNGDKLTFTIQGTKPANKQFGMYIQTATGAATEFQEYLTPVEGLTDVWSCSSVAKISQPTGRGAKIAVYQLPPASQVPNGKCTILWAKLEKGDTRTPNIDRLRYKGIGVTKNSINKYLWEENTLLEKVYTNSIDFGNYDYSGNPNLMNNISINDISTDWKSEVKPMEGLVKDNGDSFVIDLSKTNNGVTLYLNNLARPIEGKRYTWTIEAKSEENITSGIAIRPVLQNSLGTLDTYSPGIIGTLTTSFVKYKQTYTTTKAMQESNTQAIQLYFPSSLARTKITIKYSIKWEEGNDSTPYQPNLLDAPYYLSKVALGENLIKPESQQPVTNSNYLIKSYNIKPLVKGKKYTITLEGTKPATQVFRPFFTRATGSPGMFGDLQPVEGLTDIWSATFTFNADSHPTSPQVQIYQVPNTSVGQCTIKWLKLEEGDTRTPNILDYKYIGEKSIYSNDYKNINWDVTEDYIDNKFNIMVDTVNPQSIGGTKNFLETPFVNGKEILYGDRLFEGFYGSGQVHSNFKNKARISVGGLVMDDQPRLSEPFEWNSGRWQATVTRDVMFYCRGTMYIDTGGNMGKYLYIANWKDSDQTQYASGNPAGMGIAADNGYWYRNLKDFSWIVSLKKGDKFSIGIELAADKEVWNIQLRTLHIKELIPPL